MQRSAQPLLVDINSILQTEHGCKHSLRGVGFVGWPVVDTANGSPLASPASEACVGGPLKISQLALHRLAFAANSPQ